MNAGLVDAAETGLMSYSIGYQCNSRATTPKEGASLAGTRLGGDRSGEGA